MTDDAALLAAIAAHPDEDVPRLAYADWLEEHDQPIRAEFIRVQIEVAHKEMLPRGLQYHHVDLFRRNQELIDNHRAELLWPVVVLPFDTRIEFHRGFVSMVELPVERFLLHGEFIAGMRPLPAVRVTAVGSRLASFLRSPHLNCVTHVGGYSPRPDVEPSVLGGGRNWPEDSLAMLDAASRLTRLESLDLEGCGINDLFCDLAYNFSLPALIDLDLSNNVITDAGVTDLLRTGLPAQLKRLILGGNPIGDPSAIELAERWPEPNRLEQLNLRFTNIGRAGQQAILARFGGKVDLF